MDPYSNIPPPYYQTLDDKSRENYHYHMNPGFGLSTAQKYQNIVDRYEISIQYARKLSSLQGCKIVFILDDSGSMNTPLGDSPLNKQNTLIRATRWDELQHFAKISVEIATLFDSEGCDLYFLNRKPSPVRNVKDESQLIPLFENKPKRFTPLTRVLEQVLHDNSIYVNEKKLLIIIATDGEPTDDDGKLAIEEFKKALKKRNPAVFTTIIACTDNDDSMNYLNGMDRQIRRLDIVDDYRKELDEIKKMQGPNARFSYGDYVVKSLIGSIDKDFDRLDEKPQCCIIV